MIPSRHDTEDTGARQSLRHEEFIRRVQRRSGLFTPAAAVLAAEATLAALGERLRVEDLNKEADEPSSPAATPDPALELASLLPERLRSSLSASLSNESVRDEPSPTEFSLTGLFERVGAATGVGLAEAERHARAVALTLGEAAGDGELDGILYQLPDEYEFLFV